MGNGKEVELKLEIDPGDAARLRTHRLLAGREVRSGRESSVYYDTAKGALREAGYSLRIRRIGDRFVQTVKARSDGAAGLFDRAEWESEVAAAEPDIDALGETPLGALLKQARLRKRLKPVVSSEVQRTVWLLPADGAELEIILDQGAIRAGGNEAALSEVEIELKKGDPAALVAFARGLAADLPLRIGVMTKAERGFALAVHRFGKATKAERVLVQPAMTVAEAFAAIVHACLRHFRLNEPLVVARRDATALHQSRVAMRRLRSALSLFAPALGDPQHERLREELRWFTDQLGEARNLDVFLKRLPSGRGVKGFRKRLEAARGEAYDRVIEALATARMRALMLDLVGWAEFGAWRSAPAAAAALAGFASERLGRRWKKVRKQGRSIAELDPEPRHRLRIDVKKLRYAVEFLSGLYRDAPALKPFTTALESIQESLGELNDMETARELIGALPADVRAAAPPALVAPLTPEAQARRTGELIADAQRAHAALLAAGPFWKDR